MTDYEAYLEDLASDYDYDDLPRCERCGRQLKKYVEKGEYWGSPYTEEYWECPECD